MYHPKLGRFLQTDPIFYADQMNMYAYVGNDPINRIDTTGLQAADPSLTCAARFYCEQSTNNTWTVRVHTPRGELIKIEERSATDEYGKPPADCSRTPGVCAETAAREDNIAPKPIPDEQDSQESPGSQRQSGTNEDVGRATREVRVSEPEIHVPEVDVPEPELPQIDFLNRIQL